MTPADTIKQLPVPVCTKEKRKKVGEFYTSFSVGDYLGEYDAIC
jgi:hypothetical protein